MKRCFIIALALGAGPVLAQDGPSFDCAQAEGSAEDLVCEDAALAALDRRVAARYAGALAAARGLDAGAADAENTLRATQRGWIGGRDECWKSDDLRACVEWQYQRREAELVATWMLQEPTGTTVWACDGNPGNEVVTMYFDTELPSLRFERGDGVDVGTLERTASGSKYAGSFGREIWIKGDAATYREPDPDGSSLECEATGG